MRVCLRPQSRYHLQAWSPRIQQASDLEMEAKLKEAMLPRSSNVAGIKTSHPKRTEIRANGPMGKEAAPRSTSRYGLWARRPTKQEPIAICPGDSVLGLAFWQAGLSNVPRSWAMHRGLGATP